MSNGSSTLIVSPEAIRQPGFSLDGLDPETRSKLELAVLAGIRERGLDLNPPQGQSVDPVTQALCDTVWGATGNTGFVNKALFPSRLPIGFGVNLSTEGVVLSPDDEVLLVQGSDVYAGQYCNAGKIWVKGVDTLSRLKLVSGSDETGLQISPEDWKFVGQVEALEDPRGASKNLGGHWACNVYVALLRRMPKPGSFKGDFFHLNNLPQPMVWSHESGVLRLIRFFLRNGACSTLHLRYPGTILAWYGGPPERSWDTYL